MSMTAHMARQFDIVWGMIGEAVAVLPDTEWKSGADGPSTPVIQLAHIAAGIALYLPPPGKHWPRWCEDETGHFDWRLRPDPGPGREEFGRFCSDVRAAVAAWLATVDDAALLQEASPGDWRGNCRFDLLMYVLRHSQHHLGELNAELRRRGIERPKWR